MRPVIIEARINEYARRAANPNVPFTVAEIVADARACVAAGASIIHFHARQPDGAPAHDYESYRDVVAALRDAVGALIHPTLGVEAAGVDRERRLEHIERLCADGLTPDLVPLDMGSSNVDMLDPETGRFLTEDVIYLNTTATLHYFAERLRNLGVTPYPQLWNIPHARQMAAFLDNGYLDAPVFAALAMTSGGAIATHPGSRAGLSTYLPFLPEGRDVHWSTAMFSGNLLTLVPDIVELGGHVSIGIGDYPYPELDYPTNGALVAAAAERIGSLGARVATVAETRAMVQPRSGADQSSPRTVGKKVLTSSSN